MKKNAVKFWDKIILLLLSFPGIFNSCNPFGGEEPLCEYGMPHADFVIKGTVTDEASAKPIPGIRIVRQVYPDYGDTLYTNTEGNYIFEFGDFPYEKNAYKLKIEDIDGEENGGEFFSKEIDVEITKADRIQKGNGHWYDGKFEKIQNIGLLNWADAVHPEYGVFPVAFKP